MYKILTSFKWYDTLWRWSRKLLTTRMSLLLCSPRMGRMLMRAANPVKAAHYCVPRE